MTQFGETPSEATRILVGIRYTLDDVKVKMDPRDYASRVVRAARGALMYDTLPQLNMVYSNITVQLRQDLYSTA